MHDSLRDIHRKKEKILAFSRLPGFEGKIGNSFGTIFALYTGKRCIKIYFREGQKSWKN